MTWGQIILGQPVPKQAKTCYEARTNRQRNQWPMNFFPYMSSKFLKYCGGLAFFRIRICRASSFCICSFQSEDSSPSPSVQQHLFKIHFFLWLTQKAPWLWSFLYVCFSSFDSCFWSQLAVPKSRDYWSILLNVLLQIGPKLTVSDEI